MTTQRLAICIATHARPRSLAMLLTTLERVRVPEGFHVEVRIVDNDQAASAASTVLRATRFLPFRVRYAVESERNISKARNAAVRMGPAAAFVFIDDDEWPSEDWLVQLVQHWQATAADAVIGEVRQVLPSGLPRFWYGLRLFDKTVNLPLDETDWTAARTSNALVAGPILGETPFNPEFGGTGGEDTELFRRLVAAGGRIAWAPQAVVFESILRSQCRFAWLWKRRLRCGRNIERLDPQELQLLRFGLRTTRSTVRLVLSLPKALVGRPERAIRAALSFATAIGRLQVALGRGQDPKYYPSAGAATANA